MKVSRLIVELIFYRIRGYKYIDFFVNDDIPPSAYCDFVFNELSHCITLTNYRK